MSNHGSINRRTLFGTAAGLLAFGSAAISSRSANAAKIESRIQQLGLEIPAVPASVANYVPYVITGNLVYLSGQVALCDGELVHPGIVPRDVSIEAGQASARQCAMNLIAGLKDVCRGDLDRVTRCVRLEGFVASQDGFTGQSAIINGASDLIVEVFGDSGRHSRVAIGVNALPLNASVEISAVFEIS